MRGSSPASSLQPNAKDIVPLTLSSLPVQYIRTCIAKDVKPHLVLLSRRTVCDAIPSSGHLEPMYARRAAASQEPAAAPRDTIDLYSISDPLEMTVCGVQYLNVSDVDRVSDDSKWWGVGKGGQRQTRVEGIRAW